MMTLKKIKTSQLKGKPLHMPVSAGEQYSRRLRNLVKLMTDETRREIMALFRSDDAREYFATDANIAIQFRETLSLLTVRFETLFVRHGENIAKAMIDRTDEAAKLQLQNSFNSFVDAVTLRVEDMPAGMKEILAASVSENVDLIKSIPSQYLDKVKGAVMRSITTKEGGIGRLTEELQKYDGITKRRAGLIAMDQTRKAYQTVNLQRSRSAGIKKGTWVHTGGTKEPRKPHKDYNGKEFDLEKGAPIGANGEYVQPGQEPFCRCTWIPIVDFEDL